MSKRRKRNQAPVVNATGEVNRTYNMQFRVTEEELKRIEERQKEMGIQNRSAFLRRMVLNGWCINLHIVEMMQMGRVLHSLKNNLNQYAKKANATGNIYHEDINCLQEKYSELINLYVSVLEQLSKLSDCFD